MLPRRLSARSDARRTLARLFGIDKRSLALFRVGLATVVIIDIATRFPNLVAHYADAGILPRAAVGLFSTQPLHLSLYFLHGGPYLPALLFATTIVVAALMLLGYRTRLTTTVLWFLVISLHVRNPGVLNAGDATLRMLLFWSMFLPLGLDWSLDRAMAHNGKFLPQRALSFGTAGVQLQVAFIYLFTWVLKTGPAWRDGTAVEMSLRLDRLATQWAGLALDYPGALPALTHAVFWFELLAALALFIPFGTDRIRLILVPAFMLMHLGFAAFLGIGLFPLISILSVTVFIPSLAWEMFPALSRGGAGLRMYYDGGCSFCLKMTRIIKTFLVLPKAVVLEAQSDVTINSVMETQNSWVVVCPNGNRHTRGTALRALVAASPIFHCSDTPGACRWPLRR